jgi:hypothetical protein
MRGGNMSTGPENEKEEQEQEYCGPGCGGHHHWGHHRMHMMRFAAMTLEEEIEFLEAVKERLEERLSSVNARLQKLKA